MPEHRVKFHETHVPKADELTVDVQPGEEVTILDAMLVGAEIRYRYVVTSTAERDDA